MAKCNGPNPVPPRLAIKDVIPEWYEDRDEHKECAKRHNLLVDQINKRLSGE